MTTIAVITGNPKPASRTHTVALAAADALAKEVGETGNRLVIDLANHASALFDHADPELADLDKAVARWSETAAPSSSHAPGGCCRIE